MLDAGDPGAIQPPSRKAPARRESPPPLEANDRLVTAVFTAAWAVALIVLLAVRSDIPPRERWWIWVAATGLVMGLFALWYVPHLQRSRARAAERRTTRSHDNAS
jgi:amino acid transporter